MVKFEIQVAGLVSPGTGADTPSEILVTGDQGPDWGQDRVPDQDLDPVQDQAPGLVPDRVQDRGRGQVPGRDLVLDRARRSTRARWRARRLGSVRAPPQLESSLQGLMP